MPDTGVLVILLETKKRKKTIFFDSIDITKFHTPINKIKKLYLRLLFITSLL